MTKPSSSKHMQALRDRRKAEGLKTLTRYVRPEHIPLIDAYIEKLKENNMSKLNNGNIITGYYGKDGAMSEGWDTENEAQAEFDEFYQDEEYEDCEIIKHNDKWVIAY